MFFDSVQGQAPDIMNRLKQEVDSDTSPNKVDLGVGVYRNAEGNVHELTAITNAKAHLSATNPNHDYEAPLGHLRFLDHAAKIVFGDQTEVVSSKRVASVQSLGGTGAIFLGMMFLRTRIPDVQFSRVYLGTPTWPNYKPLAERLGFETFEYQFYDPKTQDIDMVSQLEAINSAPEGSVFVFQGCCHNPTAMEFSKEQWHDIADAIQAKKHIALFDIAYQGLGKGLDEDNYGVHCFAQRGNEILVCQSSSKNFGLYGERLGALHVVCKDSAVARNVTDQLRILVRTEYSCSPLFGARLVDHIMSDSERLSRWRAELDQICERLQNNRKSLRDLLVNKYETPGNWDFITRGSGLFSMFPFTQDQCLELKDKYRIYIVVNGRMAISGLTEKNMDYVAKSIDAVVRG